MGKSVPSRVGGPLFPFASGFWVGLRERGYEWTAVHARMRLMAEVSVWMGARGIEPRQLTEALVAGFLSGWCAGLGAREAVVLADVGAPAGGVSAGCRAGGGAGACGGG